jgi:hypothetical protein
VDTRISRVGLATRNRYVELRISMALATHETETLLNLYNHIEDEDLARGDAID